MTDQDSNVQSTGNESSKEDLVTTSGDSSSNKKKLKTTLISLAVNVLEKKDSAETKNIIVRKLLGKTIHSEVYRGETSTGKQRALIAPSLDDQEVIVEFVRSCKTCFPLKHPNIVKVFECVEINKKQYALCELFEAVNLKDVVSSIGVFETKNEFYSILNQICEAIKYAHSKGVIHGNLKPSNVLLCEEDGDVQIKLTEFGRAKFKELSRQKQDLRPGIEEVCCWSPEHCNNEELTEASDVYQVGILAYYMLTGTMPYEYQNVDSIMQSHTKTSLKPAPISVSSKITSNVSELNELVSEALDTDPEWRIQNIKSFQQKLLDWYQLEDDQVNLGQMSLDDMIEDAQSNNSSPITPSNNRKVSTTIHNLVALKKKQMDQEQTVLMQLSEKVSAKGPRLSPAKSISKVGIIGILLVFVSGSAYFIFANHINQVEFLWNEASLSLSSTILGSEENFEEEELVEAPETTIMNSSNSKSNKKPASVGNKNKGLVAKKSKRRKKPKKKYMPASDYYKKARYGTDNNSIANQGKSNRRIIDYKEFNENWLK